MAVNSLGYRKWHGKLAPPWNRTRVIAETGIRRARRSRWLMRMMFFAWLPALWFALGFFLYEKSLEYPGLIDRLEPFLMSVADNPQLDDLVKLIDSDNPRSARHGVWAWLLQSFFRHPQGVVMALVVGLIAPPLISQDIRSRAFLLYFSRPLGRGEYILGKLATIWAYLCMITLLPALVLYVLGILLSPEVGVIAATWDLPFRVLAATVVISVPTASLALCISSYTQESRYAAFAWFAIWILGWVTFGVLSTVETIAASGGKDPMPFSDESPWIYCSLYHTLGRVQSWVFGFADFQQIQWSALLLVALTCISLFVLFRRVDAPMRA